MSRLVRKNIIMDAEAMRRAIVRIAHEIIEKNKGVENIIMVGIRTRGVPLAQRIAKEIENIEDYAEAKDKLEKELNLDLNIAYQLIFLKLKKEDKKNFLNLKLK